MINDIERMNARRRSHAKTPSPASVQEIAKNQRRRKRKMQTKWVDEFRAIGLANEAIRALQDL